MLWTIAASRVKAEREHRVPLSAPALAILDKMKAIPVIRPRTGRNHQAAPFKNRFRPALRLRLGYALLSPEGWQGISLILIVALQALHLDEALGTVAFASELEHGPGGKTQWAANVGTKFSRSAAVL